MTGQTPIWCEDLQRQVDELELQFRRLAEEVGAIKASLGAFREIANQLPPLEPSEVSAVAAGIHPEGG
jgi:hypothetical protein